MMRETLVPNSPGRVHFSQEIWSPGPFPPSISTRNLVPPDQNLITSDSPVPVKVALMPNICGLKAERQTLMYTEETACFVC